jgi:hypothetical protein
MVIFSKYAKPFHQMEELINRVMRLDHAAKANQSDYPWAQNIVSVGLLKRVHARWACLPCKATVMVQST